MKERKGGKKLLLFLCYINEFVLSFCLCAENRNFDDHVHGLDIPEVKVEKGKWSWF